MTPEPGDWTREESRYVDGETDAAEARHIERRLEEDAALAKRLSDWHEAMDLWRSDAAQRAAGVDLEGIADRVLEGRGDDRAAVGAGVSRRYATAALVLIGIGLAGTFALGGSGEGTVDDGARATMRSIEQERLDLQANLELERLAPHAGADREGGD